MKINHSKLLALSTASILAAAISTQAATIVPTDYTHATGNPGPEPNSGDDSATTRLNDNVISTGSWSDGLHVSWGQGTILATEPTATITFEFDNTYDFSTVDIYQYTTTWGATDVRISTSTDNVTFSSTTGIIPIGTGTAFGGSGSTQRFTIDVSSLNSGQYVRVDLLDANSWIMLSEVDFTAVPEPSAALFIGLGSLGLITLRRRR